MLPVAKGERACYPLPEAEDARRPATETELPARETTAQNTNSRTEGLGISSE